MQTDFLSKVIPATIFIVAVIFSPFLPDGFVVLKWVALYVLTAFISGYLILNKALMFPVLTQHSILRRSFYAVVVAFVFCLFYHVDHMPLRAALDWSVFCILALGVFRQFKVGTSFLNNFAFWNNLATACVMIYGYLQIVGIEPIAKFGKTGFPYSLFGFQNITAEFIGLSVVIQFYFLATARRTHFFYFAYCGLTLAFLYYLKSRAGYLATAAGLSVVSVWHFRESVKVFLKASLVAICVFVTIEFAPRLVSHSPSNESVLIEKKEEALALEVTKQTNTRLRLSRWLNTFELIKQNPMGVAPGQFEFAYVPYRAIKRPDFEPSEKVMVRTPHNGYIELFSSYGLIVGLLVTFFVASVLLVFIKLCWRDRSQSSVLFFALIVFIAADALFAFPLGNPYPFFITAICAGYILFVLDNDKTIQGTQASKVLAGWFCAVAVLVTVLASFFTASQLVGKYRGSAQHLSAACKLWPEYWRACVNAARLFELKGNHARASEILQGVLTRTPQHFFAKRILAQQHEAMGNKIEACRLYIEIDELFQKQSSLHEKANNCR